MLRAKIAAGIAYVDAACGGYVVLAGGGGGMRPSVAPMFDFAHNPRRVPRRRSCAGVRRRLPIVPADARITWAQGGVVQETGPVMP